MNQKWKIRVFGKKAEAIRKRKASEKKKFQSIKKLRALNASLALTTLSCSFASVSNFVPQIFGRKSKRTWRFVSQ